MHTMAGIALGGLLGLGGGVAGCGGGNAATPATHAEPKAVANPLPVVFLKRGERKEMALAKAAAEQRAQQISFAAGGGGGNAEDAEGGASLAALMGDGGAPGAGPASAPVRGGGWTILLGSFTGPQAEAGVQRAKAFLAERGLGGGVRVEPSSQGGGDGLALVSGVYASPADAQVDLARFKELDAGGVFPFGSAMLSPIEARGGGGGSRPEFELRTAAKAMGEKAIYTLQVGVYRAMGNAAPTPEELASFRKAAEEAVMELRRAGGEAFYFHGPTSSTVCVGLFGEEDVIVSERDPTTGTMRTLPTPRYSPRLVVTQQEHPHNLVNGQGVKTRRAGEAEGRLQSSFLIRVPE